MAEYELAIRARRAVTPAGVRPATVAVRDGRIAAVAGFKAFLVDSGVPEFGFLGPAELDAVLAEIARLDALLIVHAEDPGVIAAAPSPAGRPYAGFLASRPPAAEDTAISRLLAAAG